MEYELFDSIGAENLSSILRRRVEESLYYASEYLAHGLEDAMRRILNDELMRLLKRKLYQEQKTTEWILKGELARMIELRKELTRSDDYIRIHLLKLYYDKVFMDFDNSYDEIYSNFIAMLKESKLKAYNA